MVAWMRSYHMKRAVVCSELSKHPNDLPYYMKIVSDFFPKSCFTNFQALWRALVDLQLSNAPRVFHQVLALCIWCCGYCLGLCTNCVLK